MPDTSTPLADDFELPIAGFQGTPEEIERQWFEQVYKGRGDSMLQLTWRAVLMGSLLGGVLSLTNLYIGLKSRLGLRRGHHRLHPLLRHLDRRSTTSAWPRRKMTILENNCMQSTASSAGYSTGGTLISAFAAYIMLNGHPLPIPLMLAWVFFLAVLGVTMAIPMKRQMINIEQLRFPSGIAAAETLRALHSHGDKGMRAGQGPGHRRRAGRDQPVLGRRARSSSAPGCEPLFASAPGSTSSTSRSSARPGWAAPSCSTGTRSSSRPAL